MRWTLQEIAQALGVAVPPGLAPLARLAGVSIDSRAVGREQLFIAIRGPRHDGHDFVAAALQAGAAAPVGAPGRVFRLGNGISRGRVPGRGNPAPLPGTGAGGRGPPGPAAPGGPRSRGKETPK